MNTNAGNNFESFDDGLEGKKYTFEPDREVSANVWECRYQECWCGGWKGSKQQKGAQDKSSKYAKMGTQYLNTIQSKDGDLA